MRVIALMVWFDENPTWLSAAITSVAPFADHLVAVDGGYFLYPDSKPRSGPEQHEAIIYTAHSANLGCTIHTPQSRWMSNEVEKRNHLFKLGELEAEQGEDWLMVLDADEVIEKHPSDLRPRLEATDLNVAQVTAVERHPEAYSNNGSLRHFDWEPESRFPVRKLFRANPGIHCAHNHYTYMDGEGRRLWGYEYDGNPIEEALDLTDLVLDHRTNFRTKNRSEKADQYYKLRDKVGAEGGPCTVCGALTGEHSTIDWEFASPKPTKKGERWELASGWTWACPDHQPELDEQADRQIREMTDGHLGLGDVAITKGKVPRVVPV